MRSRRSTDIIVVLSLALGSVPLLGGTGCSLFRPAVPERVPVYRAYAENGALEAGAASVDVTPAESVWLAGYDALRESTGVHDSICARALVLRRGEFKVALVALDVIGLQRQDLLALHARLPGFDPRHLIVAATHNHSGPDTLGLWGFPPFASGQDSDYMEQLFDGIVAALAQAEASLRPAELAAGAALVDPRGLHMNMRRPGIVDARVPVLHVRERGGGATIATVVELGCHPEVLGPPNQFLTADFPHWTVERLEAELGGIGIYVSGAVGGLVTPDVENSVMVADGGTFEEAERVGTRLANHAIEVVQDLRAYDAEPPIEVRHAPIYVRNANWIYDLALWMDLLERDYYGRGYLLSEVNLWQVGALRIATFPGEITPDQWLRIAEQLGDGPAMPIGLANDELGYLLPSADYAMPIYRYERTLCIGAHSGDAVTRPLCDLFLVAPLPPQEGAVLQDHTQIAE